MKFKTGSLENNSWKCHGIYMNSNATSKRRKKIADSEIGQTMLFLWTKDIFKRESKFPSWNPFFYCCYLEEQAELWKPNCLQRSLSNSLYKFYVSRPIAATLRSGIVFNVVILWSYLELWKLIQKKSRWKIMRKNCKCT